MKRLRLFLLLCITISPQLLPGAPRRYGREDEIALRETRDSLDVVKHGVDNLETELQMFQERVTNQEETLDSMRQQLSEMAQSTKELVKGNSSIWEHKLNALETANKTLIADFSHLKTHANESAKALEKFDKRVQDLERLAAIQSKNVENLQTALRALTDALQVKETVSLGNKSYQVRPGDSLEKIAKMHQTTVKAIKALNNLANDQIFVDQKIQIP